MPLWTSVSSPSDGMLILATTSSGVAAWGSAGSSVGTGSRNAGVVVVVGADVEVGLEVVVAEVVTVVEGVMEVVVSAHDVADRPACSGVNFRPAPSSQTRARPWRATNGPRTTTEARMVFTRS